MNVTPNANVEMIQPRFLLGSNLAAAGVRRTSRPNPIANPSAHRICSAVTGTTNQNTMSSTSETAITSQPVFSR